MSKRKKHPYKQKRKSTAQIVHEAQQEVLQDMLECNTVCGDLGKYSKRETELDFTVAEIDELLEQLPGVDYVLDRIVSYMFSNGLTTGNDEQDAKKLDPWLYETKNKRDVTNYEELRITIRQAKAYGECGLRIYEGNLYHYKRGLYGMIVETEGGIDDVQAYFIRKDGKYIEKDFSSEEFDLFDDFTDLWTYFDDNGYILLDPSEFINVRNDTSSLHGESPFTKDRQRLDLLLSVYERLNYDIDYDGPGRIIVRPKDGRVQGDENGIGTGQIIDNSLAAQAKRNDKAKAEVRRVAREIKESTSDSVILLSNAFGETIEHLPRVTKATEFFDWIENDTVILAQMLGMSPTLLEVGKLHGNISVEKIIDNAMLNTIIPMRESFAVQFSKMISERLGVEKIYFDKYDMQQVQDENDVRGKVATMIKDLSAANKSTPNENTQRLIDELNELLRSSLYDDKNMPRTL